MLEIVYPASQYEKIKRVERLADLSGKWNILRARIGGYCFQIEIEARGWFVERLGEPLFEGEDTRRFKC